ncbi:MAG: hypothetical protein ACI9TV_003116 [Sulfurimonas sp.]|jgi:uncharacterized protein (DUF302 family)|uniref:DUF302 domain-containing protein n=1 Tax=Sulfurimonas sp. TaxID=2022749 RepID=UPI0039E3EC97
MLYIITTDKSIDTVRNEMEFKAKELGFGVLKEYKFQNILKSKGYPIDKDITVFELCNPIAAQTVLSSHPEVSVYLPCRISLYLDNGKTTLSTIGLDDMLHNFNLEDELKAHMKAIFDKLKTLLGSWE